MSYERIGNHKIRKNGKKISIFDAINHIKTDIKSILPEIEDDRLIPMMSHCRRYYEGNLHYGRRSNSENLKKPRDLTSNERILYEYLLGNSLNPSTAYRWFLATRIPEDIKKNLEKGQISCKKAMEISANRRRVKESNSGLLMMEEINNIIKSL